MSGNQRKASDQEITSAYMELKSCRLVGKKFGMCTQSVHDRVVRLGISRGVNLFTDDDRLILIKEYAMHSHSGTLANLAKRMGRTKAFICKHARALGLTTQDRPRPWMHGEDAGDRVREAQARHGHPRGMAGKRHSAETRERLHIANLERWAAMSQHEREEHTLKQVNARRAKGTWGTPKENREGATWKAGWREIGGYRKYYRSRWEANYARYLEWLRERGEIRSWQHEPKTFWFDAIRRGVRSYLPDFLVVENSGEEVWHEVKGWMDQRSRTTLKRMAKYYPGERVIVIDGPQIKAIDRKMSSMIVGWERPDGSVNEDAWIGRRIRKPVAEQEPAPPVKVKAPPRKRLIDLTPEEYAQRYGTPARVEVMIEDL